MPVINFLFEDGSRRSVEAAEGSSILEVARKAGIDMEGACGGSMACATCHVVVDEAWFERLAVASAEEEDMLDLAPDWQPTSRLGCQVRLTAALDGLSLLVPRSSLLG
ncbi:2Fe-2S iron-sulfur cluster-binding protein [Marinimicrococcus flavescens]|uniref:2Fe-2S iron-sulfur cluster-binding protein n=1 Tax=Marinimicrococcus flavescens TaxID=3031815 RepID=A0AAP3UZU7_9PROT|nr:2Fe-2S iron-sulfur cluster-binding protein [Marinimicrococcus flavescens]